jgi:hypothetical protein
MQFVEMSNRSDAELNLYLQRRRKKKVTPKRPTPPLAAA